MLPTQSNSPVHGQNSGETSLWRAVRRPQAEGAEIGPIGEFIDALACLQRGHVLVRISESSAGGWMLNGAAIYTAQRALVHYGLVRAYDNPEGFEGVGYFRLTPQGKAVADQALRRWRELKLWQRLWLRALA